MPGTTRQIEIEPSTTIPHSQAWLAIADATLVAGDIVVSDGASGVAPKVTQASNTGSGTTAYLKASRRGVALTGALFGSYVKVVPWQILTDVVTTGAAVGDPVYLSSTTAGRWTLTAPTAAARKVGEVLVVSATAGIVLLAPQEYASATGNAAGILYENTADSAAVPATAAEVAFDKSVTLPANLLTTNQILKVRASGTIPTTVGATTYVFKLYIGTTVIITTPARDGVNADVWSMEFDLIPRAVPGAAVACSWRARYFQGANGAADAADVTSSGNIATNGTLLIKASVTWSDTDAST